MGGRVDSLALHLQTNGAGISKAQISDFGWFGWGSVPSRFAFSKDQLPRLSRY
jgi:hypothetical protein